MKKGLKDQFLVAHVKNRLIAKPGIMIDDFDRSLCVMEDSPEVTNIENVIGEAIPSVNLTMTSGLVQYAAPMKPDHFVVLRTQPPLHHATSVRWLHDWMRCWT